VDHARRPRVLTGRGQFGLARPGRGGAVRHRSGMSGSSPAVRQRGQCSYRRPCPRRKPGFMHRSALDHYGPYCPVNTISPPVASPSEDDAAAATVHLA
jgi:hypothetical protein